MTLRTVRSLAHKQAPAKVATASQTLDHRKSRGDPVCAARTVSGAPGAGSPIGLHG